MGEAAHGAGRARLELLGAAALFSTGGAAIKACSLGAAQVAGLRSAIAALAFLALVPAARSAPSRRVLLVALAYGGCLTTFVLANKLTTAADAIFLQSSAPLYLLFLAPWLLGERIRRSDVFFMGLLALGVGAFFLDSFGAGGGALAQASAPDPWSGRLVALGSGVLWALTVIGLRWLGREQRNSAPVAVLYGNVLAGAAGLAWAGGIPALGLQDLLVVLYLGVFQIALAYKLVSSALARVPAFEASVLLLVEPVFNPLWAWLVHGEVPGAWALVGGAILTGATLAKSWYDARPSLP